MSDNELYSAAAKLFAAHSHDVDEAEATGWGATTLGSAAAERFQ